MVLGVDGGKTYLETQYFPGRTALSQHSKRRGELRGGGNRKGGWYKKGRGKKQDHWWGNLLETTNIQLGKGGADGWGKGKKGQGKGKGKTDKE